MGTVTNMKETGRDEDFVMHYVSNGGNATQAAIACGVSETSAGTIGHRLKIRLRDDVEMAQKQALKGFSEEEKLIFLAFYEISRMVHRFDSYNSLLVEIVGVIT